MSEEAYWNPDADPEMVKRENRIAALRAEMVLLGRDPEWELLTVDFKKARVLSLMVHHALGRVDLSDADLAQVLEFEKLLEDKGWLMASPRPKRSPGVL